MDQINSFSIKKVSPAEIDLAKQLFLLFQTDDGAQNPTAASDEYLKKLLAREDFHVLVAIKNETVIGGLTAYEITKYKREYLEMFLYEIGVSTAYRKQGAATALIEFLRRICREKGIHQMFVLAEAENFPALKLYETTGGKGFEVIEFDYEMN